MNGRHYVKIDRSPEEQARVDALREHFQRERPSLDELVESGEFEPSINQGEYWDMVEMVVALRREREAAGLDRDTVAGRMGIDSDWLTRLETGKADPTLELLRKYASAVGKQIVLTLTDLPQVP
ncbi:MAG: helix-turn-helix domain-containing protein, partial [Pirellulales bacterium]